MSQPPMPDPRDVDTSDLSGFLATAPRPAPQVDAGAAAPAPAVDAGHRRQRPHGPSGAAIDPDGVVQP